jgi:hypothetical protein
MLVDVGVWWFFELKRFWMSVPVTPRDNNINFYNKYLLLLEEYIDNQAGRQIVR